MKRYYKRLIILGDPQAQKRHRTYTKDKNGRPLRFPIRTDPSKKDKDNLRAVIQQEAPERPLDCPVSISMSFYFKRPKSHYRTGKYSHILKETAPTWHTSKPDRDNLDKFFLDALTGIFLADDKIVCSGLITKCYSEKPRTEIVISDMKNVPIDMS